MIPLIRSAPWRKSRHCWNPKQGSRHADRPAIADRPSANRRGRAGRWGKPPAVRAPGSVPAGGGQGRAAAHRQASPLSSGDSWLCAVALGGYAVPGNGQTWGPPWPASVSLAVAGALLAALIRPCSPPCPVWRRAAARRSARRWARAAAAAFMASSASTCPARSGRCSRRWNWAPPSAVSATSLSERLGTHHAAVLGHRFVSAALMTLPFAAGPAPYRWAFLAAPAAACLVLYPKVLNFLLDRLLRLARRPCRWSSR